MGDGLEKAEMGVREIGLETDSQRLELHAPDAPREMPGDTREW